MSYAQKNYSQIQGINGKYKIAQIGCLLTAFCNLLERFGMPVDPPTLNQIFKDRGIFIDIDDGVRDDLGWQSVTAYNGQIVTAVKSGVPTERNVIVRLAANNSFGTHFCLVDHIEGSTIYILDSWDGQVKPSSVYGPITGWALYTFNQPQPVGVVSMDYINSGDVTNLYRLELGREPEPAAITSRVNAKQTFKGGWYDITGSPEYQARQRFIQERLAAYDKLVAQVQDLSKRPRPEELNALQVKVAEGQTKIAELEQAIKDAPAPVVPDEKQIVQNVLVRFWNSLFKKG